jgi:LysR family glycine cleavage system transcriptional activator
MARGGAGGTLELGVVPTFASRWLLPRLPDFLRRHPGITLNLHSRIRPFLFEGSELDAALHAGHSPWPGTDSVALMRESLVAVAAPAMLGGRKRLKPAEVARLPLLQMATRPHAWRAWFDSAGVDAPGALAGPRMDLFSMISEAAVRGLGAALVPRLLIEDELQSGRLVVLADHAHDSDRIYSLIYPEAKAELPALVALKAWLAEQAAPYATATPTRPRARP